MRDEAAPAGGAADARVWRYRVSGLVFDSALQLEELEPCHGDDAPPDVVVRFGKVDPPPGEVTADTGRFCSENRTIRIALADTGRFLVRDGREIVLDPDENHDEAALRFSLLGGVFSALYHQRGLVPLHASAVVVGGRFCVALVGDVGAGKSTTAAFLSRRGYGLMADDVLVVDAQPTAEPVAFRNSRRMNLRSQTRDALGLAPAAGARVPYDVSKRQLPAAVAASVDALPLRALYLLTAGADGERPRIETPTPPEALASVLAHTYRRYLVPRHLAGHHLRSCTRLINAVAVHRLVRRQELAALPTTLELLEDHFALMSAG